MMDFTGTVLVASGAEETLERIVSWLSRAGFRVQAVRRGGDALLAILEERVKIAIIEMSADDSLEMGRRIFALGISC